MSKNRLFHMWVAIALVTVVGLTAWSASTTKVIPDHSFDTPQTSNDQPIFGASVANPSVNIPYGRGEWYCTSASFGQPICRQ